MPIESRRSSEPPRPSRFTLEDITRLAKESALKQGQHIPTVVVEGSLQPVYAQFKEFPGTHEERLNRLFAAGYSLAEEGQVGNLKQVFFISEGWLSTRVTGTLPDVPPSQDPNRQEVLIISCLQILGHKTRIRLLEMLRNSAGKLIGLRELDLDQDERADAENPLLDAFVAGFHAGRKRNGKLN